MGVVARQLPIAGYAILKIELESKEGALAGGEELKKRFPMLQIKIYDAQTKTRNEIHLRRS